MQIQEGKHLTFSLGKEEYGIPILQVKEIIGMMEFTEVPKTPEFIKGVVNLRGKIIPIMDLRTKFGMESIEYTERTCIIVVEINVNNAKKPMGIVVDMVSEVVTIEENDIDTSLEYGTRVDGDFLTGLGKVKGKVVILLNIEKIINSQDLAITMDEVEKV